MSFDLLDKESEVLLQRLLDMKGVSNNEVRGVVAENLVNNGFLKAVDIRTMSDSEPVYLVTEITQKGQSYFELKASIEDEKKMLSRREWLIAIISALIGALVGLIPTIVQVFQG